MDVWCQVSVSNPAEAGWRDVIPQRQDAVIERVGFGRGLIVVTYRKNASDLAEVFDVHGKPIGAINQPGIGEVAIAASEDRTEAFLNFSSFNYPPTIFRVDLARPAAALKPWLGVEVPVDPASVDVEQVWYPAKDGTRISMFLAHKKGLVRSGRAPTLLAGYGGFNASLTPTFSAAVFQWFEVNGIFAVPNLRGGGEYGEAWHEAGMLGKKQNAVDDLIAASDWLISNKYTSPVKLAVYGGANGGLIGAAAITQHPDRFRAAVLLLPVLDMVRYPQFASGREWVPEYGSPDDPAALTWLLGYSPYHHVMKGAAYPGVLLTALGEGGVVHPMHARKMAAALQAATGSDPGDHPILLRVDNASGQTSDGLFDLQLRDVVDQRIFLMWQLGVGRN
jgi:prolyl oligopeptidase